MNTIEQEKILLDLLVWHQGKGDEYRERTLLVDMVTDFLKESNYASQFQSNTEAEVREVYEVVKRNEINDPQNIGEKYFKHATLGWLKKTTIKDDKSEAKDNEANSNKNEMDFIACAFGNSIEQLEKELVRMESIDVTKQTKHENIKRLIRIGQIETAIKLLEELK